MPIKSQTVLFILNHNPRTIGYTGNAIFPFVQEKDIESLSKLCKYFNIHFVSKQLSIFAYTDESEGDLYDNIVTVEQRNAACKFIKTHVEPKIADHAYDFFDTTQYDGYVYSCNQILKYINYTRITKYVTLYHPDMLYRNLIKLKYVNPVPIIENTSVMLEMMHIHLSGYSEHIKKERINDRLDELKTQYRQKMDTLSLIQASHFCND